MLKERRVVITGIGAVTPLGNNVASFIDGLESKRTSVKAMPEWSSYFGLRSLVAAPVEMKNENLIPRQARRTMGRMSIFSVQAAQEAIQDANLDKEFLTSGRFGCVIGSTTGSAESLEEAYRIMLIDKDINLLTSTKFFQCVSHTAALNVAYFFGIKGIVMATSAACASGLQAVGQAYDLVKSGKQDVVICGGAEGVHPTVTGSFDVVFAASTKYNNDPQKTPRPFDKDRDGLVCGEGAGILVLEDYESAKKRDVKIYAEVIGYDTCGSGVNVSQSNKDAIVSCMQAALKDANIDPQQIDYVNAHATATLQGDKEEVEAIKQVFGANVPVSSLKGYMGHTLGASGAVELIASLVMMQKNKIYSTLNLENVSDDCQGVMHVQKDLDKELNVILKNCFAFGGINAALICRKIN